MFKKKDKQQGEIIVDDTDENIREVIVERRSGFNISEVIIIMIIAIMFGFLLGNIVNFVVFDKKGSSNEELEELVTTYDNIINNYYEDVNKEKLVDAGIQGMINYLDDPYATYFSGAASDEFNDELAGNYEGIGIEVTLTNGVVCVANVFANSPASKVGIKEGDILVKVDDTDINGKDLSEVVSMISGEESNNKVKLTILRDDKQLVFEVGKDE